MIYIALIGWALLCLVLVAIAVHRPLFRSAPKPPRLNMCQCGHEACFHLSFGGCWKRQNVLGDLCSCTHFVPDEQRTHDKDKEVNELRRMSGFKD